MTGLDSVAIDHATLIRDFDGSGGLPADSAGLSSDPLRQLANSNAGAILDATKGLPIAVNF